MSNKGFAVQRRTVLTAGGLVVAGGALAACGDSGSSTAAPAASASTAATASTASTDGAVAATGARGPSRRSRRSARTKAAWGARLRRMKLSVPATVHCFPRLMAR